MGARQPGLPAHIRHHMGFGTRFCSAQGLIHPVHREGDAGAVYGTSPWPVHQVNHDRLPEDSVLLIIHRVGIGYVRGGCFARGKCLVCFDGGGVVQVIYRHLRDPAVCLHHISGEFDATVRATVFIHDADGVGPWSGDGQRDVAAPDLLAGTTSNAPPHVGFRQDSAELAEG